MKVKTPRGLKIIRTVTIVITLVVLAVVGSVIYSAYQGYNVALNEFKGGQGITSTTSQQGLAQVATVNVTIPNKGLYDLNVTISCPSPQQGSNAYCQSGTMVVPPGQQGVLTFHVVVQDLSAFLGGNREINATVSIALVPYASLSFVVNLGNYLKQGGA
jgi:hypothetical protein